MKTRFRTLLLLALLLGLTRPTGAQVAPPRFLPGQPMVVGEQILMLWGPVPGATQYAVFHNDQEIARVASNQYLGPLPQEPGEHRFQVAAISALGALSGRSEPGTVRVRRIGSPQDVIARPNTATNSIDVLWNRVEGAAIYNVYRSDVESLRQLVASVREETFKDAQVVTGRAYRYEVTARDLTGQEGPPSTPVNATLEADQQQLAQPVNFRALPTTEVFSLASLADRPLDHVTYLGSGPQGSIWLVTPKQGTLHSLDGNGELRFTWGPYIDPETGYPFIPHKLAHGPDGNLYVSDALNGALACLDGNGTLVWVRNIPTPPANQIDLWRDFPPHLQTQLATPSAVLCRADEIWVTDQRFQLIYQLDYRGAVQGHLSHYRVEGERLRLPGVGELLALDAERTLLTFPLSHHAVTLDAEHAAGTAFGVQAKGYLGAFVGIHGVSWWATGQLLFTDPAVATLQVFDAASGRYLFHLSGPTPGPTPPIPSVPTCPSTGRFWGCGTVTEDFGCTTPLSGGFRCAG